LCESIQIRVGKLERRQRVAEEAAGGVARKEVEAPCPDSLLDEVEEDQHERPLFIDYNCRVLELTVTGEKREPVREPGCHL
jgi:hypothetical protein